jgi:hypothetical protein
MKSLHFLMVYNADGIDTARDIAERELKRYGLKNIGRADWYEIGSVVNADGSEFTTDTFERPVYTAEKANEQVEKWLNGVYDNELMTIVKKGEKLVGTGELTVQELCTISKYYENRLAAQNYRRKYYQKPFDIVNGSEFNEGMYDEFGATWAVSPFDGSGKYIVAVYKK